MNLTEKILLALYCLVGILCLFVVGYLETSFLQTIFTESFSFCVFCVIVIEAFKSLAIFYHRYSSHKRIYNTQKRIAFYLFIGRITALVFSFIVCITTVSTKLDNPTYAENNLKANQDSVSAIFKNYLSELKIEREKNDSSIKAYGLSKNSTVTKSVNQILTSSKIKNNYNQRIEAANKFEKNQDGISWLLDRNKIIDSIIFNSPIILQTQLDKTKSGFQEDYKSSENKSLVSVYNTFKNIFNSQADFQKFKYAFIIIIGILVSFLLEIIIVNIFNYLAVVYLNIFHPFTKEQLNDQYLTE